MVLHWEESLPYVHVQFFRKRLNLVQTFKSSAHNHEPIQFGKSKQKIVQFSLTEFFSVQFSSIQVFSLN